ncbi:hypothetical protein O6H91_04G076900 [Diphasiastrum complanatum]|uniref:Uncharacterized protein n=2 Tax=Diphasiastrum complanatum TaxID=34168 RepID=A0ACC2DYH0_DIPCM|nr:hypothetical protein O6H91_04G076900 [Diphasiastrum complanatum]KAJ7559272.1 hypothetical protein O6H91_04G076900 [Diphasiastrum complanatum]
MILRISSRSAMSFLLFWAACAVKLLAYFVYASQEPLLIRQVQSSNAHLIVDLPGAPPVSFAQYSGYITVDERAGRALFYWFVEADVSDPTSAPLTLWLNGGPGCSSVGGGMLSELGPFYPDKDGLNLQLNPYSWNEVSNIIFLESPAGVGFSYSNSTDDYVTGDAKTAEDSYVFLQRFWELFPAFSKNPFYVAGESYAGHYVPQLAALIISKQKLRNSPINFKGIVVGNAWTDPDTDDHGSALYWWSHALISDESYNAILAACNFSSVATSRYGESVNCNGYVDDATNNLGPINIYDIYVDICISAQAHNQAVHFAKQLNRDGKTRIGTWPLLSNSYDPCVDNEVEVYLNRPDVQAALHANVTGLPYRWIDCSDIVNYSQKDGLLSMLPTYRTLLQSGLDILIYSGDVDAMVPVTGTRAWISKLNLNITKKWKPWFLGKQVGGYVTHYAGLTFATVRDAGHMVPYTQPLRALHLFKSFITETPL